MTVSLTKPFHLSRKAAIEGIEAALAERGREYVYSEQYEGCQYVARDGVSDYDGNEIPEGTALCLVGVVLDKAGFPLDDIDDFLNGSRPIAMVEADLLTMDEDVLSGLTDAQVSQDCAEPWGTAADKFYAALKS